MADFSALKTSIQNYIKQNGNEEITGNLLQQILLSMVTTLGDSAINDFVTALNAEIANRGNADTELDGRITTLQGVVNGIVANVGNGYVYAGIATPSSTPASGKVFYLALTAGTYTNFGATVVPQGINILKYNGTAWSLDSFLGLDDAPTQGSRNLVKSGGVLDSIIKDGSAFDLSAYNNGTTYADLSAALTALNALPAAYKKGGMSIKYVQSSDNNYIQARCIANEFTTDVTKWQSSTDEVKVGSKDLVESGAVAKSLEGISHNTSYNEDEEIVISDNEDNEVVKIDKDGVTVKDLNIQQGDETVNALTELNKKLDKNETTDYEETVQSELVFSSDDGTEDFCKIGEYGIKAKNVLLGDELLSLIDILSSLVEKQTTGNAILDKKYIEDNWPYYNTFPENVSSYSDYCYLEKKIAEVPEGFHFMFVTDTHINRSARNSNYLMSYVKKRLGIKTGIFGGDTYDSAPDKYKGIEYISKYSDEFFSVWGDNAIYVEGNHEGNLPGLLSNVPLFQYSDYGTYLVDDTELYKRTISHIQNKVHFDDDTLSIIDALPYNAAIKEQLRCLFKFNYYYDDNENKTRFIVIDTGTASYISMLLLNRGYGFMFPLVYNTLARFLRTTPEGYNIVVAGHMLAYYDTSLEAIISAFKVGASTVDMGRYWGWKTVLGMNVYQSEPDRDILATSESECFVVLNDRFVKFERVDNTWTNTGQMPSKVFNSVDALQNEYPNPTNDMFAYVSSESQFYKYIVNNGEWELSSDEPISSMNITYGTNSILLKALFANIETGQFSTGFSKVFANKIFTISGHWHMDAATYSMSNSDVTDTITKSNYSDKVNYNNHGTLSNDAVLNIVFDTDSYARGSGVIGVDGELWLHTPDTVSESSFNVVTINENHVYITRFGAGENREFTI